MMQAGLLVGLLLAGLLPPCAGAQEVRLAETYTSPDAEMRNFFGAAVAGAGDIDGDGTPDLLIGADGLFGADGDDRVYLLSGASGKVIRVLYSPNPEDNHSFGAAVTNVGDVDEDGYPDLLIGAPDETTHGGTGRAYLLSGTSGEVIRVLNSPNPQDGDLFGAAVSGAEDINGDGTPDLLIGAEGAGRAYLLSGTSGEVIQTFTSPNAGDYFGSGVAKAGDADGDGYPDLLVGASKERQDWDDEAGRVYLLSGASGEAIRVFTSPSAEKRGSHFGAAVAQVGDTDGDSTPDLLVGASEESPGGEERAGRAYLLSGASGELIRAFISPNAGFAGGFGASVAHAGDIDGDGHPDLLVGASGEDPGGKKGAGRAYRFEVNLPLEARASRLLSKRRPNLVKPKGEFETTEAHQKRQRQAEAKKEEILKDLQREGQKEVQASLTRDTLSIRKVGSYNADREIFPITVQNTTYRVEIPLKEARSFDENWRDATVIAYKQLTEDLSGYRWFNRKVIHPVTGSRYPVGPQKEIKRPAATQKQIDPDRLPKTTASVNFTEPSGNGRLDGGEMATLTVTAENTGQGPARQVRARISPEPHPHLTYPTTVGLGTVPADSSASELIQIKAGREVRSDSVALTLQFEEARGFSPSPVKLRFETKKFVPPELTVADVGIDDASGNGVIEPGEVVDVTARIRNASRGRAEDVSARVHLGKNVFATPDTRQSFNLGDLGSGEHQDVQFSLVTNQQAEAVPVTLDLSEKYGQYGQEDVKLPLQFDTPTDRITEMQVEGQETDVAVQTGDQLSVDIETNIPTTAMDRPDAVAVVVGIRSYAAEGAPDVEYARRDARFIRKYLTQTLGFREENILPRDPDGRMTYAELRTLIQEKLPSYVKEGTSEVFVYYSGHGAPSTGEEKRAYLVPSDTDPNFVSEANAYRMERFYEDLARLDVKSLTVALDACFTGQAGSGDMMLRQASPLALSVENPLLAVENATGFLASGPEQVANWYPAKKHGMFTYFFLKGLKGEADLDGNRKVTAQEMKRYLTDKEEGVPYWSGRVHQRTQDPQVLSQNPEQVLVQYEQTRTPDSQ